MASQTKVKNGVQTGVRTGERKAQNELHTSCRSKVEDMLPLLRDGKCGLKETLSMLSEIIPSWAMRFPLSFLPKFNSWFQKEGLRKNYWMIHYYVNRIHMVEKELSIFKHNVMTAGLFCFMGQLILYYCQYGLWDQAKARNPDIHVHGHDVLDMAFDFASMYMYVDYFFDDVDMDEKKRKETLSIMLKLLDDPECMEPPERMKGLVNSYINILRVTPQSKIDLIKLFMTELEGVRYQKNPNLTRREYMDIAERKGGLTGIAIQSIFRSDKENGAYEIGVLLQLIDDMIDVHDDIEDGVHTIATHDLQKYGNMDRIFSYTAAKIYLIPATYTLFRFLLMEALCYALSLKGCFSSTLIRRHKSSILLNGSNGNNIMKIMDQWIKDYAVEL